MGNNIYSTVQAIVEELRKGGREYSKYIEWLKDQGLSQDEAEKLFDRLLKQVDEEE